MDADRPAIKAVAESRERTHAAASARIELSIDHAWEIARMPRQRRGGLMRPATSVAKAAGKRLLNAATRNVGLRHQSAEGVIDLQRRRWMLDYGSYARLYADGKEWGGRSGRLLSALPSDEHTLSTPLWLLDALAGLTAATEEDAEEIRGTACRHFATTVDIGCASSETPGGVAVRTVGRFEDLLALPVEVWIDEQHIRRVRFPPSTAPRHSNCGTSACHSAASTGPASPRCERHARQRRRRMPTRAA